MRVVQIKPDGFVKNLTSTLRRIPRHCGVQRRTIHSAECACLEFGAFYRVIRKLTFSDFIVSCILGIFCCLVFFSPVSAVQAEEPCSRADCVRIEDEDTPTALAYDSPPEPHAGATSYLSKLWELDVEKPRGKYAIMMHRSNYILPVAYNDSPNRSPFQDNSTGEDIENTEVKFQLSLKVKLWQDILGRDVDLWFGYTQKSFWQFYDFAESAPFRETNYEPEVLLNFRTNFKLPGLTCRTISVGFNHQSNGRSEPYSRSWNRIVGNLGFERERLTLLLNMWYRIPESDEKDDNPDLDDYVGYGELWGYYFWNGHRFGAMLRNNLKLSDNRGAFQLEWSIPLTDKVGFYIQYYNGYGESLLDYNHSVNRIGAGVSLINWQ